MSWINVGSPKYKDIEERKCLNAYMFWIGVDCYSMTPAEARDKFPKELWNINSQLWIRKCILTQNLKGLDEMRKEYTRKTGKEWMKASLNEVKSTLHYSMDLYEQGKVLNNGMSIICEG